IAQCVVTGFGLAYFFSHRANLRLCWNELRLKLDVIPQIFAIGTSSFFMYAYGSMMVAMHNALFAQYGNQLMIGAYAILGYIVTVYYLTAEGIANGMQPLVSYNYGAKHPGNIRKLLKIAMVSSVSVGIVFAILLNVFPREFVSVFSSQDSQLVEYTVLGIRLHLFALALDGFLVVTGAYYQAVNKGGKAMFVMLGNLLIQLPFLYIMPKLFGVPGIWMAYPLSNIALSVVVIAILMKDIKKLDSTPLSPATA
ncbi:MATE family efflux transporter, partial [Vibrio genomosp. F10]